MRGSIISAAPIIEFASRFARTAILSRLIAPTEFGTSVAISVALATTTIVTDVGLDKFLLIQPDEDRSLEAAHVLTLMRGVLLALALALAAPSIAEAFGVPQFANSFALIALFHLIQSFANLQILQARRHHQYAPGSITVICSQLAALLIVVPAVYILHDHRAIVVSFLTEVTIYTIASHILATKPYRLRWDRRLFLAALSYGAPLTLNGIGLAAITQFDRVLVARWFGVETLGLYALILSLSITPISLILRVFGTLGLSYLAPRDTDNGRASDRYLLLIFVFTILATSYSLLVAISLDWLLPFIYGHAFDVAPGIHLLMTAMVFLRLQTDGAPTVLLLTAGKTREVAFLNLTNGIGLVIALVFIVWWPNLEALLLGELIGASFRLFIFIAVSSKEVRLSLRTVWADLMFGCLALLLIIGFLAYFPEPLFKTRVMLFCAGILAIGLQFTYGMRRQWDPLESTCRHASLSIL